MFEMKGDKMKLRKLISLYPKRDGTYFIDFAYYKNGKWTGESESGYLSERELYNCVKNKLTHKKDKEYIKRIRRSI